MRRLQEQSDMTTREDEGHGNYARKRRARQHGVAMFARSFVDVTTGNGDSESVC